MGHPYPATAAEIGRVQTVSGAGSEPLQYLDHASVVSFRP